MSGVLLSSDVTDAPFDVSVGIGLDESVDGADASGFVARVAVGRGGAQLQVGGWDGELGALATLDLGVRVARLSYFVT